MTKLEQWQKTIDDWKSSGLSQKDFCQNHSLKIHTMHYWIRQLKKEPELAGKFLRLSEVIESTDLKPIELSIGHARIITLLPCLSELLVELDRANLLYDPA